MKTLFGIMIGLFLLTTKSYAAPQAPNLIAAGKVVKIHYTLTVDGKVVDSSKESQQPLSYTQGKQMMIPGLEKQLEGKKAGDKLQVTVKPEEAYGPVNPKAYAEVPLKELPKEGLKVGAVLTNTTPEGQQMHGVVSEIKKDSAVLNFNHPLAGKELHFDVEIVEVA